MQMVPPRTMHLQYCKQSPPPTSQFVVTNGNYTQSTIEHDSLLEYRRSGNFHIKGFVTFTSPHDPYHVIVTSYAPINGMPHLAYLGQMLEKEGEFGIGIFPKGSVLSWDCQNES